jgi:hypothetical protein
LIAEAARAVHRVGLRALPPLRGAILIGSSDVRAKIFLDGKELAETPAKLSNISAGKHRLELVAPGHDRWSGEIEVEAGQTTYVSVTLLPK